MDDIITAEVIRVPSLEPLEKKWKVIIWCSLLLPCLGAYIIIFVSSFYYYYWLRDYPVKAKSINFHGWMAWLTAHVLWFGVLMLLSFLLGP